MALGTVVFIISLLLAIGIYIGFIQFWSISKNNNKQNGKVFSLLSILLTIPLFYIIFFLLLGIVRLWGAASHYNFDDDVIINIILIIALLVAPICSVIFWKRVFKGK